MSSANIVYDATTNTYYSTLSDAITDSSANDLILVSGSFSENFPDITHSLTIQAIGTNLVSLTNPQPTPPNGRAVLDCPLDAGVNLTISGLEISGANNDSITTDSQNGAGILFEVGNGILNVNHCWIQDNEDGILTGGPDSASPGGVMSVFVNNSEINNNGLPSTSPRFGYDHNIYAGDLTELSVTNSYIHDALGGHEIKSRALTTIIEDDRIDDGPTATTSYSVDVPDGGANEIVDNVIEKGPNSPNENIIHFGGDATYQDSSLLVSGNTIINDRSGGATVVLNQSQDATTGFDVPGTITNNTIYDGNGAVSLTDDDYPPAADVTSNNTFLTGADPPLDTSSPNASLALEWTGAAADTDLSNAANWEDLTDSQNPSAQAPGPEDTLQFTVGGGSLTNTLTAAAVVFSGADVWTLGSTAAIDAFGNGMTVGSTSGTRLVIGAGGRIATFGPGDAIGAAATDLGTVDVAGTGADWTAMTGMTIGAAGTGFATILAGATVVSLGTTSALVLGAAAAASGSFMVSGTGSRATLTGQLNIGQAGTGSLLVENQGTVTAGGSALAPSQGVDVGQTAGAQGTVTVTGGGSLLDNTGEFIVGDAGSGAVFIDAGGSVATSPGTVAGLAGLVVSNTASAAGSAVSVVGTGSQLSVAGLLDVGAAGSGALLISGGATATAGSLDAANVAAAVAQIDLSGAGTSLLITNTATVADDGTGVMSVLSGATFSASSLMIGARGDSSGAVVVSGSGSTVNLSGSLNIGTANGTGDLTVGPGAAIHASAVFEQGQVVLEGGLLDPTVQLINQGQTAGGFGTIAAGDIVDEGAIQAGGNKASQKLLIVQGTVLGGGTLTVDGTQAGSVPAGILQINAGGTLELSGAVLNAATTVFTDNLTPQGTYTVNNSIIDVNFVDSTGVLLLDDIAGFAGTITTYQAGDEFVITGGTLSGVIVSNGDTLLVSDSGASAGPDGIDQIIFNAPVNPLGFKVVNGNTVQARQIPCFAAGTLIETAHGPVAVENLRPGDRIVTGDGQLEPVVWIGEREVDCARHPEPETIWPVRVRAGAFGENVPQRDLYLSPDHAIFVNDVLVPVKLLIDGIGIAQVRRQRVRYYHVELPRHAVIFAENLPVESYLDTGDRWNFNQSGETVPLFPDFTARLAPASARIWQTHGAAPLVVTGEMLAAAQRSVAAMTSRHGFPIRLTS